jgi:hypothetical protein
MVLTVNATYHSCLSKLISNTRMMNHHLLTLRNTTQHVSVTLGVHFTEKPQQNTQKCEKRGAEVCMLQEECFFIALESTEKASTAVFSPSWAG